MSETEMVLDKQTSTMAQNEPRVTQKHSQEDLVHIRNMTHHITAAVEEAMAIEPALRGTPDNPEISVREFLRDALDIDVDISDDVAVEGGGVVSEEESNLSDVVSYNAISDEREPLGPGGSLRLSILNQMPVDERYGSLKESAKIIASTMGADIVRELRKASSLSSNDVQDLYGVPTSRISEVANGASKSGPSLWRLVLLSRVFGKRLRLVLEDAE